MNKVKISVDELVVGGLFVSFATNGTYFGGDGQPGILRSTVNASIPGGVPLGATVLLAQNTGSPI